MRCPKCGSNRAYLGAVLSVSFNIVNGKIIPVYVNDLVNELYDAYDCDPSDVTMVCFDCDCELPVELNEEDGTFEILDVDEDGNVIGRIKR